MKPTRKPAPAKPRPFPREDEGQVEFQAPGAIPGQVKR